MNSTVNLLLLWQEDLQDMFEDMNEINDMMGRAYGVPDELDEAVGNVWCHSSRVLCRA